MEVLTDSNSPVLISNAEVMEMLNKNITKREKQNAKRKNPRKLKTSRTAHRDWIEEKLYEYLKTTPCVDIDTSKVDELKSKLMSSKKQASSSSSKTTVFNLIFSSICISQ